MPDSFILKVDWAEEYLKRLDSESSEWIERESERIVDEPDPNPSPKQLRYVGGKHRRFRVTDIEAVPDRFSLLIGDCVHNLRSALDHIALALGQAHTRRTHKRNMTIEEVGGSEFPIYWDGPIPAAKETRKIRCLDPNAIAVIKDLQPHHRKNLFREDPLWRIHELDRIDKHRRLTICVSRNTGIYEDGGIAIIFEAGEQMGGYDVMFRETKGAMDIKPGAILSTYTAIPLDPSREVKMKPSIPLQITFGKGETLEYRPIAATLRSLCAYLRDPVFARLTPYL